MSKRELENKVEEQHKHILFLEKKLKDVVRAYKSLESEKNALQNVVESFKGSENAEESPHPQGEADESTLKGLKDSLAILTKEKIRRENALQQDKKLLLQENESLKERLKTAADDSEVQAEKLEKVIKELTQKIRRIEMGRESELTDHGNVLAEMQQRYAKEKISAENAQKQLVELYKKLQEKSDLPTQFKTKEKELQDKISEMKKEIEEWKAKAERSPTVQLLQDQMANMKIELEKELEERLSLGKSSSSLDKQVNSRICELEEATQRLTERVAECEREKYEALDKLKKSSDESNELKLLLQKAEEFKQHINEEDATKQFVILGNSLLKDGIDIFDVLEPNPRFLEAKTKLERITDEYEKYKLKAEAVLKSKTSNVEENVDNGLRTLVSQLHDKIKNLEVAHATDQAQYELTTRNMRERISELERSEEICRNQMKKEMQGKISEMEAEMQKQRSRTLEILAEKEQELEATK
ncbi:unnamed protein product [Auanema sp. JU1783]|nr:unnamed protein product [Auanema sp. JU1783]